MCGRHFQIIYNDEKIEASKPFICRCGNSPALVPISSKVKFICYDY